MDLEANFTEILNNMLNGDFSGIASFFYLAISIALYAVFIWHFYRFIATRDCIKIRPRRHKKIIGVVKYLFIYPFIAFIFFMGFSLIMNFLTKDYDTNALLSTSFAIIIAIRITAYYSQDLSRDLAKMLPFALLGLFLVDPSYFDFSSPETAIAGSINAIPEIFTKGLQFIIFITLLEWILRILLTIRYYIFPKKRQAMYT